ncbi:putative transcription factor C2H2 family [Rosa chinensis]|uniref:RING-type E3 ubiquitin transferase n=1 Tax=Rosa chinensis TaxID=74649 RepID=A0A2P6RJR4_ROSCH|nr:E3 ubiquitin-protein ligase ATL42 isoform X1 [Rosa chinensis]PRQ46657.1 putative transcription factor C2H2 family [Rosa chinensis]
MIRILGQFQDYFFPMFRSSLIVLLLFISVPFMDAEAQSVGGYDSETDQSNFQPSVAVVIGILALMFALTFVLLVYAKFCHRRVSVHGNHHLEGGRIGTSSRFSGIDKTVIEALPFFRFSNLKGSKEGLECAVCLSKFEDIEVLRLLPKCKHAFHIDCIDHWLEKHSSCPLCRHKVSSEDLTFIAYSNSMRVLWDSQSERREDSNIELFVQREEDHRGSSRFSVGSSFRKMEKGVDKGEELLIQEEAGILKEDDDDDKVLHRHKHKIVVSDFVFQNRWSNLSSSDLIFLNSEMLNTMSSSRFSTSARLNNEQFSPKEATGNDEIMKIREEMEMKRLFENKVSSTMNKNSTTLAASTLPTHASSSMNQGEKRSMSEITALSRFGNWGIKNRTKEPSLLGNNVKEERMRRLWLPIARRTVQWFANREKRSEQPQHSSNV